MPLPSVLITTHFSPGSMQESSVFYSFPRERTSFPNDSAFYVTDTAEKVYPKVMNLDSWIKYHIVREFFKLLPVHIKTALTKTRKG